MRSNSILVLWLIGVCCCSISTAQDLRNQPQRTWRDNTGTFSVLAELTNFDRRKQQVTLQLKTGESVTLPIRRLSDQDRQHIANLRKEQRQPKSPRIPTTEVAGIPWIDDLEDAKLRASGSASRQDDKPILCFRVLGDLDGFM